MNYIEYIGIVRIIGIWIVIKMSVKIHRLGNACCDGTGETTNQRSFVVDLTAFKGGLAVNFTFPLGDESLGFIGSSAQFRGSELMTSNTIGNSPYTSTLMWIPGTIGTTAIWSILLQPASSSDPLGGLNGDYSANPKQYTSMVDFTSGSLKQLQFTQTQVADGNSTNTDTFIVIDAKTGINYYELFYGFDSTNTFTIARADADSDFQLLNNIGNLNGFSCSFTNVDNNLEIGAPEEHEGGFLYRIFMRPQAILTSPGDILCGSSALVQFYKIDITKQTWTYPTGITAFPSDSIHPLSLTPLTNGTMATMTSIATTSNFILLPSIMTFQELFDFLGFTSISTSTSFITQGEYFFKIPQYTLYPNSYPNNAIDTNPKVTTIGDVISTLNILSPFTQISGESVPVMAITNDITTRRVIFQFFIYNMNPFAISINGVQIKSGINECVTKCQLMLQIILLSQLSKDIF